MNSGVYEIVNTVNGKRYVGSSQDFLKRWKAHRFHLGRGTHHSPHLQAAWAKHGAASFEFRPMVFCLPVHAVMYEQIAIDALRPEMNVAPVAGSCLGVKHSAATKEKQRLAKLGNTHTLGMRHRPESIDKLRAKQLGVESPTKGKPRDADAVAATAAAHRGMKRSDETRRRISEALTGKKRAPKSEATRAKLSEAMKRRVPNPDAIARMAETKRGSTLTAEHKARIGAASRAAWAKRKASTP